MPTNLAPKKDKAGKALSPAPPKGRRGLDGSKEHDKKLTDDYTLGEELGHGAFGVVYACKRHGRDEDYRAVKMVDKAETPVQEIKKEAEILDKVDDINIIKYHDVYYEKCFVCIVMDRLRTDIVGAMEEHWETKGPIPPDQIRGLKRQCVRSLNVIHRAGILHRDIKGDNFLLDKTDIVDPSARVVLTDFGASIFCDAGKVDRFGAAGTKLFWAPEFFKDMYGHKVDIWAFGVLVYGLIEGKFPFKDEHQVNVKKPRIKDEVSEVCVDFLRSLLKKDMEKRVTAQEALNHPWIKLEGAARGSVETEAEGRRTPLLGKSEDWKKEKEKLVEDGAKAAARERRYELVERLEDHAQKEKDAAKEPQLHFLNPSWKMAFRNEKKVVKFEWWPQERVEKKGLGLPRSSHIAADLGGETNDLSTLFSRAAIQSTLVDYGIDTSDFGKDKYKTLEQLIEEVSKGSSRLMIDAAEYKKLVRVVDVVLLRICYEDASGEHFLVEVGERFPDGRSRDDLNRLAGTKKDPHENTKKVTERIVKDLLGMHECNIAFNFKGAEIFEEEDDSISYPGVKTVYRKSIVEGKLPSDNDTVLQRIGAKGSKEYQFEDKKGNTKFFKWMTEEECGSLPHPVKLRGPDHSNTVSGLVGAPIAIDEDSLASYLKEAGVPIEKFGNEGTKSLAQFASELSNSEGALVRDKEGKVVRIVEVVKLWLVREDTREILIHAAEIFADGTPQEAAALPGMKKGSQENQFAVAYNILARTLKIDQNYVNIDEKDVVITEQAKSTPKYPGVQTLYRYRFIKGVVGLRDAANSTA